MRTCACVLVLVLFAQQIPAAQREKSVATRAALDAALAASADRRAMNLEKVRRLLGDPALAGKGLGDLNRLSGRLTILDDKTLARLAKESDAVTQQTGGGGPGKVLIVIVLAIIILAVVAAALAPESS